MSIYFGVRDNAENTKAAYIGVHNTAKQILKMYIGVNGKAQLFYDSSGLNTNGNAVYLYNNGDECTAITGGWIGDNDDIDGITCVNTGNYLMIQAKNASNNTWTSVVNIATVNTNCVPFDKEHILYVEYSLISTEVNNEKCHISILTKSSAGGTAMSDEYYATSSSVETLHTATAKATDVDYGKQGVRIQLLIYGSETEEVPDTTLKIYRVWYETI